MDAIFSVLGLLLVFSSYANCRYAGFQTNVALEHLPVIIISNTVQTKLSRYDNTRLAKISFKDEAICCKSSYRTRGRYRRSLLT